MPYADPEKRKAADRERKRAWRAGQVRPPARPPSPELAALQLSTTKDVLAVLGDELTHIIRKMKAGTPERARVVALLASGLLRAIEQGDLSKRIAELEALVGAPEVPGDREN